MSKVRASHIGRRGAVSAAHPLAVVAGQQALFQGGNAADAMIAAQAALCVVLPASCGLGGDLLALIHQPDGDVVAINGIGRSPANPTFDHAGADGSAVTVPGIVDAWARINARYGRLSLGACLSFAHELAVHGARMGKATPRAVRDHRMRLEAGEVLTGVWWPRPTMQYSRNWPHFWPIFLNGAWRRFIKARLQRALKQQLPGQVDAFQALTLPAM